MLITGKDLLDLGFKEGPAIGEALNIIKAIKWKKSKKELLDKFKKVLKIPRNFTQDAQFASLAQILLLPKPEDEFKKLKEQAEPYQIYGAEGIEAGALKQMDTAMKLPVTVGGALMPDAHQGYGLPIGGVLATHNAVIPYGVGMDIGCRMCLTLYDLPEKFVEKNKSKLKNILLENTHFGKEVRKGKKEHAVLESTLFKEIPLIKTLKDKAASQLGSSGGGNHFVEFGVVEIVTENNDFNLPIGKYAALLSHSGSRGFGGNIAQHYTKLAKKICKLPGEAQHLAWLDLDTEEGQEYWLAMNLAGDYASACHHQIHERIAAALGEDALAMVENHHNFAWKEQDAEGKEIIVHRKGATPAGKGVLGIIPGSMTAPGFIVRGKGERASINSASHGAGRMMSRTKAKQIISKKEVNQLLSKAGVEVIGAGLDEAPMAYKDIHKVMEAQLDLVEVLGMFMPKVVRMCGDDKFYEGN
jgi:tRNA-splicing ligase RtcB